MSQRMDVCPETEIDLQVHSMLRMSYILWTVLLDRTTREFQRGRESKPCVALEEEWCKLTCVFTHFLTLPLSARLRPLLLPSQTTPSAVRALVGLCAHVCIFLGLTLPALPWPLLCASLARRDIKI